MNSVLTHPRISLLPYSMRESSPALNIMQTCKTRERITSKNKYERNTTPFHVLVISHNFSQKMVQGALYDTNLQYEKYIWWVLQEQRLLINVCYHGDCILRFIFNSAINTTRQKQQRKQTQENKKNLQAKQNAR